MFTLANVAKSDFAEYGHAAVAKRLKTYHFVMLGLVVLWALSYPGWEWFVTRVINAPEPAKVLWLVQISLGFYMVFAFNNLLDAVFHAMGRFHYIVWQSVIINFVYYGAVALLWYTGVYVPTVTSIALIFAASTALDYIPTYLQWRYYKRKYGIVLR